MLEHDPLCQPNQDWHSRIEILPEPSRQAAPHDGCVLEANIEDYLDKVFAPLVPIIPYPKRQELRDEMREHLDAMIAAHEELGSEPKEAVELALRQFGAPKAIAARWRDAWQQSQKSFRPALRYALRWFGVSGALFCIHIPIVDKLQQGRDVPIAFIVIAFLIGPLLSGFATGWRQRARPILAAFIAQAIIAGGMGGFMVLLESWYFNHANMSLMEVVSIFSIGLGMGVVMTPVAAIGALTGKFLRSGKKAFAR